MHESLLRKQNVVLNLNHRQSSITPRSRYYLDLRGKVQKVKSWRSPWKRPRRSRGEVEVQLYSFLNLGTRWGWVVNATPRPLYPPERHGTHCTGGWVGPRAGLDWWGKSRPIRIRSPDCPVAILTELSRPAFRPTRLKKTAQWSVSYLWPSRYHTLIAPLNRTPLVN